MRVGMVSAHTVSLTGLAAGSLYHYRVKSKDAAGNLAVSSDAVFTTAPAPDTTPPTVSLTAPAADSAVSGAITVTATASDKSDDHTAQLQPPYNILCRLVMTNTYS